MWANAFTSFLKAERLNFARRSVTVEVQVQAVITTTSRQPPHSVGPPDGTAARVLYLQPANTVQTFYSAFRSRAATSKWFLYSPIMISKTFSKAGRVAKGIGTS